MALAFGSLWVANLTDESVYRIDTRTAKVIAKIATGLADPEGEMSVAADDDAVWVSTSDSGTLARIDPATNLVSDRLQVAPHSFCAAAGFGAVWITNTGDRWAGTGAVQRIDPVARRITATIPVGGAPRSRRRRRRGLDTQSKRRVVSRIDPATNRVVATIHVTGADGTGGDITTGAGRVWVRATKTLLSTIDPRTNTVVEQFGPPAGSGGVCVADGFVWLTAHDSQAVWVLPASGHPS